MMMESATTGEMRNPVSTRFRFSENESQKRNTDLVNRIKAKRGTGEYDCLIGLSGGVDSSMCCAVGKRQWLTSSCGSF